MLKICPKCRRFYDDADLRFCQLDGVPLIAANKNLQTEGAESVRRIKQIEQRKIFRVKTKNILMIVNTTVITIMIFSVVIINLWLYFDPPKKTETVKNETPSPSATAGSSPTPVNIPNVRKIISPTPTATPECSETEIEDSIIFQFGSDWRERFLAAKEADLQSDIDVLIENCKRSSTSEECENIFQISKAELDQEPLSKEVDVSDNCRTATAIVTFEWKIYTPQNPQSKLPTKIPKEKRFEYQKQGNAWKRIY